MTCASGRSRYEKVIHTPAFRRRGVLRRGPTTLPLASWNGSLAWPLTFGYAAGVRENVSTDILCHEKPTMTYGLYSVGASLATKREAIEGLSFSEPSPR
jgi:hypothetical protein